MFQENTPTFADATAQLCIGEPAFLVSALEDLRLAGAVQPKTDELGRLDMNDYEISETGKTFLQEDGWEIGEGENLSEDIAIDWPSLRFLSSRNNGKHEKNNQDAPHPDEVQEKLKQPKVEEWLNQNYGPRYWRVKSFYVTNVAR